jgi:PAT family beta-lactamase induction signal transducer AmpG
VVFIRGLLNGAPYAATRRTGVMVDAIGWRDFFLFTMAVGVPGMLMLQRFSPLGAREPAIAGEAPPVARPLGRRA